MKNIGCESIPYIYMHKMLILCMLTYLPMPQLGSVCTIVQCSLMRFYRGSFFLLFSVFRKLFKPPDISNLLQQICAYANLLVLQYRQAFVLAFVGSTQFTLFIPVQDKVA